MPTVIHSYYRRNEQSNFVFEKMHEHKADFRKRDSVKFCVNCGAENSVYVEEEYEDTQTCICMECKACFSLDTEDIYILDESADVENNPQLQSYLQLKEYDEGK